jgi:hypothetical protein
MSKPDLCELERKLDLLLQKQAEMLKASSARRRRNYWITAGLATILPSLISGGIVLWSQQHESEQQKMLQNKDLTHRDSAESRTRIDDQIQIALTVARSLDGKSDSQQARTVRVLAKVDPKTAGIVVLLHPSPGALAGANGIRESGQLPGRDTALFNGLATEFGTGPNSMLQDQSRLASDPEEQAHGHGPSLPVDPMTRVRLAGPVPDLNPRSDHRGRERQPCAIWEDQYGGFYCAGPCTGSSRCSAG